MLDFSVREVAMWASFRRIFGPATPSGSGAVNVYSSRV
jgi:hypothetical protein